MESQRLETQPLINNDNECKLDEKLFDLLKGDNSLIDQLSDSVKEQIDADIESINQNLKLLCDRLSNTFGSTDFSNTQAPSQEQQFINVINIIFTIYNNIAYTVTRYFLALQDFLKKQTPETEYTLAIQNHFYSSNRSENFEEHQARCFEVILQSQLGHNESKKLTHKNEQRRQQRNEALLHLFLVLNGSPTVHSNILIHQLNQHDETPSIKLLFSNIWPKTIFNLVCPEIQYKEPAFRTPTKAELATHKKLCTSILSNIIDAATSENPLQQKSFIRRHWTVTLAAISSIAYGAAYGISAILGAAILATPVGWLGLTIGITTLAAIGFAWLVYGIYKIANKYLSKNRYSTIHNVADQKEDTDVDENQLQTLLSQHFKNNRHECSFSAASTTVGSATTSYQPFHTGSDSSENSDSEDDHANRLDDALSFDNQENGSFSIVVTPPSRSYRLKPQPQKSKEKKSDEATLNFTNRPELNNQAPQPTPAANNQQVETPAEAATNDGDSQQADNDEEIELDNLDTTDTANPRPLNNTGQEHSAAPDNQQFDSNEHADATTAETPTSAENSSLGDQEKQLKGNRQSLEPLAPLLIKAAHESNSSDDSDASDSGSDDDDIPQQQQKIRTRKGTPYAKVSHLCENNRDIRHSPDESDKLDGERLSNSDSSDSESDVDEHTVTDTTSQSTATPKNSCEINPLIAKINSDVEKPTDLDPREAKKDDRTTNNNSSDSEPDQQATISDEPTNDEDDQQSNSKEHANATTAETPTSSEKDEQANPNNQENTRDEHLTTNDKPSLKQATDDDQEVEALEDPDSGDEADTEEPACQAPEPTITDQQAISKEPTNDGDGQQSDSNEAAATTPESSSTTPADLNNQEHKKEKKSFPFSPYTTFNNLRYQDPHTPPKPIPLCDLDDAGEQTVNYEGSPQISADESGNELPLEAPSVSTTPTIYAHMRQNNQENRGDKNPTSPLKKVADHYQQISQDDDHSYVESSEDSDSEDENLKKQKLIARKGTPCPKLKRLCENNADLVGHSDDSDESDAEQPGASDPSDSESDDDENVATVTSSPQSSPILEGNQSKTNNLQQQTAPEVSIEPTDVNPKNSDAETNQFETTPPHNETGQNDLDIEAKKGDDKEIATTSNHPNPKSPGDFATCDSNHQSTDQAIPTDSNATIQSLPKTNLDDRASQTKDKKDEVATTDSSHDSMIDTQDPQSTLVPDEQKPETPKQLKEQASDKDVQASGPDNSNDAVVATPKKEPNAATKYLMRIAKSRTPTKNRSNQQTDQAGPLPTPVVKTAPKPKTRKSLAQCAGAVKRGIKMFGQPTPPKKPLRKPTTIDQGTLSSAQHQTPKTRSLLDKPITVTTSTNSQILFQSKQQRITADSPYSSLPTSTFSTDNKPDVDPISPRRYSKI